MSHLREARAEALERERHQEVEETNTKPRRQIHLSQEDIDEIASYDQNEANYLEALNIDLEEELRQKKEEVAATQSKGPTTTNGDSNKNIPEPEEVAEEEEGEEEEKIDLDQTKAYVMKCLARQDIAHGLAAMETDYYDRLELVTDYMTESALFRIERFVTERLDFIVHYSKEFSENINIKLTKEESKLYTELSESIQNYRNNICKKLKIRE